MTWTLAAVGLAYLLGGLSPARWVGHVAAGIDIREHGSGNAGATNVLRVLGWRQALPVLGFDVAKGAVATWIPVLLPMDDGLGLRALCGAAAVAGHIWPLFHRFRGGRGVATAAGALAFTHPLPLAAALAIFFAVLVLRRTVWPASVVAALALAPLVFGQAAWQVSQGGAAPGRLESTAAILIAAAVVWAHRERIVSGFRR